MEKFIFKPTGVCSREMAFEFDGDIINSVNITGGCAGNLLGISKILVGKNYQEIIDVFENVKCGNKNTSCPDQITVALKQHFLK